MAPGQKQSHDVRGRFISFEGGEGSGKSTQAKRLYSYLEANGIPAHLTREPGGEEGAEAIRKLLVEGDPARWEPESEMLLFLAARYQHYRRVIRPALERGEWVISDRFHDSSRVYQGIARGVGLGYYDMLHAMILGNVAPDITLYLDVEPELGLGRSTKRQNNETRFETMTLDFHRKVRKGFLEIAEREPRIRVVPAGEGSITEVTERIIAALQV